MAKVRITDTVLRDAHQSLLATRMRTEDMLPICEELDKVGFFSVEMWGGATYDSCIRFLNEDPWDRIRVLKKKMPKTPFQMLLRGQNIVGYRHYADDVVEAFVKRAAECGIDVFRIFDALNDIRNLKKAIEVTKKVGKHAEGAICYTISPVHDIKSYIEMGRQLEEMGVDTICIKDMAGLLSPSVTFELVKALKKTVKVPIHLHTHCTSGMAHMAYIKGVEAGVDILDTAISSLSGGTSQPPTESIVAALKGTEWDTGLDLEHLANIARYFKDVRKKYADLESEFTGVDTSVLIYQIPGGMASNMAKQLKDQNALDKLSEVLVEVPKVRKEMGYIPLVTPTSQIVGTQAVMNVLFGERYKMITEETKNVVKGMYGKTPGEVDRDLLKKVLGDEERVTCRPADLIEPEMEKLKKEVGDQAKSVEDLLTYALFPQVARKFFETRGKVPEKEKVVREETKKPTSGAPQEEPRGETSETYRVTVNGRVFEVEVEPLSSGAPKVKRIEEKVSPVSPKTRSAPADGRMVSAPLAGDVLRILCKVGQKVQGKEVLVVLEAMKMETKVLAPQAGTVREIFISVGQNVNSGDPLLTLE